jgi:hypothetical protein
MATDLTTDESVRYDAYLNDMRNAGLEPRDPVAWVTLLREAQCCSKPPQSCSAGTDPGDVNCSTSSAPEPLTINAERILQAICDRPGRSSDRIAACLGYSLHDVSNPHRDPKWSSPGRCTRYVVAIG